MFSDYLGIFDYPPVRMAAADEMSVPHVNNNLSHNLSRKRDLTFGKFFEISQK